MRRLRLRLVRHHPCWTENISNQARAGDSELGQQPIIRLVKSKLRLGFRCMTRTKRGVLICEPLVKINSVYTSARISVFPILPLSPGEIARTGVNGRTCRMDRSNCRRRIADSSAAEGRRGRARPPEESVLSFSIPGRVIQTSA